MTDRIFEDARSFEVSGKGREIEIYAFDANLARLDRGELMVTVIEDAGWDSQRASFTMTREEATAMKNFLIKQGY
jgi:hypothetical protein